MGWRNGRRGDGSGYSYVVWNITWAGGMAGEEMGQDITMLCVIYHWLAEWPVRRWVRI